MSVLRGPVDPDAVPTQRRDEPADSPASAAADDPGVHALVLPPVRRSGRWRARWPFAFVIVWAALGAVNVTLFGVGSSPPSARTTTVAPGPRVVTSNPRGQSASTPASTPAPAASPTPAVQTLEPVGATAYGPAGPGSGDNPGHAADAIDASQGTAWLSDWYRSAAFGNLQAGTGLLIDMGQAVTISSVQLVLGATPGADLQLLTGEVPDRSQMQLQASANDAGGHVGLRLATPEPARYLLIWFTLLPPDSAGTYQVSVSGVMVDGTP